MRRIGIAVALTLLLLAAFPLPVQTQGAGIRVLGEKASYVFGRELAFEITADTELWQARLYYTIESRGLRYSRTAKVVGAAAKEVIFVQPGEIPPGARITYFWRLEATNGQLLRTQEKSFLYLDQQFAWKSKSRGEITLLWYGYDEPLADKFFAQVDRSLAHIKDVLGLAPTGPVKIVIYKRWSEMKPALGARWEGQPIIVGVAFDGRILALLLHSGWEEIVTHELTHLLTYQLMGEPYGHLPFWLSEGLATYTERTNRGSITEPMRLYKLNTIPDDATDAIRAYAQAQSIMKFLIEERGGKEKMVELLTTLSAGNTVDEGLLTVYGFDQDGLEREWRAWIGKPLPTPTPSPTPTATPEPIKPAQPTPRSPLDAIAEFLVKILRWIVSPKPPDEVTAPLVRSMIAGLSFCFSHHPQPITHHALRISYCV